ncbi:hypothetical protein [Oceanivirga miroungae]|uniref:Uncharacterized protein n=1 Tax=Oceanivirga miroungae TaxID=1130046 RepID=A0A6I8MA01_9FUSO|nr:hypothetical protein [Oceanivirga miroungae]VWL85649.1 hypothetical protein OMES3154_00934 [Oceanivirga miroungae]
MGVINIKKISSPKILFGMVLPEVVYALYDIALSEEAYERVLKNSLGIDNNRMVKLVEAVQGDTKSILILVIYDKIARDSRTFFKDKLKLEVVEFDFPIYNYDFNMEINIEEQIRLQEGR